MPAASLEVRGLSAGYGPTVVLEDVSFSVPTGARLSILGRNGMGKTTLLSTLMGMNRRYGGEILIRIALFALPFVACLAACALVAAGDAPAPMPSLAAAGTEPETSGPCAGSQTATGRHGAGF